MSGRGFSNAEPLRCGVEDGKYSVRAELTRCGDDLSVLILGGTRPHIGAVALGIARPSLKGDGSASASVSVLCVTGHKEDELARLAAQRLAAAFGGNVVVTAGVHIDEASGEEVRRLWENCLAVVERVVEGCR